MKDFETVRQRHFVRQWDGYFAGKTSLMLSFMADKMPVDYKPTVLDKFSVDIKVGEEEITLDITDTAGQDEFDRWDWVVKVVIKKVFFEQDAETELQWDGCFLGVLQCNQQSNTRNLALKTKNISQTKSNIFQKQSQIFFTNKTTDICCSL